VCVCVRACVLAFFFLLESTMCNSALDRSAVIKSGRTKSNAGRDRGRVTESLPAQYRTV
jgi:hypothetical protein